MSFDESQLYGFSPKNLDSHNIKIKTSPTGTITCDNTILSIYNLMHTSKAYYVQYKVFNFLFYVNPRSGTPNPPFQSLWHTFLSDDTLDKDIIVAKPTNRILLSHPLNSIIGGTAP